MLVANYSKEERHLTLVNEIEGKYPQLVCSLCGCDIRRVTEHTLRLGTEDTYFGLVYFDEVGYGISVTDKE